MARVLRNRLEYAPSFGDKQKDAWLERLVQTLNDARVADAGANPDQLSWQYNGIPCESCTNRTHNARLFAYHSQARLLFVSRDDGFGGLSIYERRGNRWNHQGDGVDASAGGGVVTFICYVSSTQRIWFSTDGAENIFEADSDGNIVNTYAMPGLTNLRSADAAYIDVFPATTTQQYIYLFNDGGEIYRMLPDGTVDASTSGLDCKQLVMRRNYGNRFTRGYFVRTTGTVSRIETDLTVSDPAGLDVGATGIPAGQEYCGCYNDLWDRLTVVAEGDTNVYCMNVSDGGGADTFEVMVPLSAANNSSENSPFNYTIGRQLLTSDSYYLELAQPGSDPDLQEGGRCAWTLVGGAAPKNIIYIDSDNGVPDQLIREAIVADGTRFHIIR